MKFLNHLATTSSTSFIMSNVMGIESTGRNDIAAERQEAVNEGNDKVDSANEAKERAGITAASAADRFTVLKDVLAPPNTDIEEKVAKKTPPTSTTKKRAGAIENAETDAAQEEVTAELDAGLDSVDASADAEVAEAHAAKIANDQLVTAQVDAAMESFSSGADSGVAEGGSGSLEANGEATA